MCVCLCVRACVCVCVCACVRPRVCEPHWPALSDIRLLSSTISPDAQICCGGVITPKEGHCCAEKRIDPTQEICCDGEVAARQSVNAQCCGTSAYKFVSYYVLVIHILHSNYLPILIIKLIENEHKIQNNIYCV